MRISLIIPTLNEVINIRKLLETLVAHPAYHQLEVIVVDGGSDDGTRQMVGLFENVALVKSDIASRAIQMNLGAQLASFDVLYFVHADVGLPDSFFADIEQAVKISPYGGFRYKFKSSHPLLRINAYFSRFPMMWCRGGDQTMYITRQLFEELNGFDEQYCVMEDFDLLRRAKGLADYHIIKKNVIVSARKYDKNNYLRVQLANLKAFRMFNSGAPPAAIRTYYKGALGLKDY